MMKAIGGTRRQIRRVYLRTALLLGAIGSVIGVALGVVIANAIVRYFGSASSRSRPASAVVVPVVVASIVLGLVAPPLAALPAIRRGARLPVREALEEVPALEGGAGGRRPGAPPARASCRGRRRSASAASPAERGAASRPSLQIALAVGTLLGGARARQQRHRRPRTRSGTSAHFDVELEHGRRQAVRRASDSADPHDTRRRRRRSRCSTNVVKFNGKDAFVSGLAAAAAVRAGHRSAGRWFTPAEERRQRCTSP